MAGRWGFHRCTLCKQVKPVEEFRSYVNKHGKVTYHYRCKACVEAQKHKPPIIKQPNREEIKEHENQQTLQQIICRGF